MRHYAFTTRWQLQAPVGPVWDAIVDVGSWPRWWKHVHAVEPLCPGDPNGLGAAHRYTWIGRLPYTLTFDARVTEIALHRSVKAEAIGDLRGSGHWTFTEDNSGTHVRYDWQVTTSKPWMNLLTPLLHPIFRWNHDQIMTEGGQALARHLGVGLAHGEG